jgi:hypothetical protein
MKIPKNSVFFMIIVLLQLDCTYSQDVVEIPYKPLGEDFRALADRLVEIDATDDKTSIELCLNALGKYKEPYIRYDLIYWELSFHYASQKQYNKCLEILKTGRGEELFYYLKDNANRKTRTEYMVQLPENYNNTKKYGLFIVIHGGIGSIQDLQYYYTSPKLRQNYIVAYFQGSVNVGSFSRSFLQEHWQERITKGYKQIVENYPIDINNIILAGQSTGGNRSIIPGLNNVIPAKGLLLSFTTVPGDLNSTANISSAERGIKVVMLCVESDWAIQQQKEFGYKLDKYGISNRFVVIPETGQEFPDNRSYYFDT